jgi:hypothetical protein
MSKSLWKRKLKLFLKPHPVLHPAGEDVYVPTRELKIAFWFEDGLKVVGDEDSLQINFNDPDLLVLAVEAKKASHIYRVPWRRLVCFELIRDSEVTEETTQRFFLN